ncbi:transcriptional regulator [Saccharomonospora piscinae]|uniref:Transcriptional regulator n=1 Tax=Saccharomonospora piscinae TaxID=687388 RepID=A0A1V8ZW17_SACPI|nr:DUF1870 family protein [Saccharomonospora piscinae]OQO88981.1 transcriptional regulator [Saccharomonospora piscinae]
MNTTDPPCTPENQRMTPAEFRVAREFLGLSGPWLAAHLGVSDRTQRHWEAGRYPIPDGVRLEIERLQADTAQHVTAHIKHMMDTPAPVMLTYATDEQYHAAHPDSPYPASWHRAVAARVSQEMPGLSIAYPRAEEGDQS